MDKTSKHFSEGQHYRREGSCFIWTRYINAKGYPVSGGGWANRRGLSILAYKSSWEEFNGKVPAGHTLDHKCRNRKCINVAHIECVPHYENVRRGNKTKITSEAVREILIDVADEVISAIIADKHGICQGQVRAIVRGLAWGNVHNDIRPAAIAARNYPMGKKRAQQLKEYSLTKR